MKYLARRKDDPVRDYNMTVLRALCPSAIWLDQGSIRCEGDTHEVIGAYLVHALNRDVAVKLDKLPRQRVGGDDRLRLERLEWRCDLPLRHGEPFKARIHFKTKSPIVGVSITIGFSNLDGVRLISYDTDLTNEIRPNVPGPGTCSVDIEVDLLPLVPDTYNLDIMCRWGSKYILNYIPAAIQLEIAAGPTTPGFIIGGFGGVRNSGKWTWNVTEKLRSSDT